jgi:hypothetical protein
MRLDAALEGPLFHGRASSACPAQTDCGNVKPSRTYAPLWKTAACNTVEERRFSPSGRFSPDNDEQTREGHDFSRRKRPFEHLKKYGEIKTISH